MTGSAFGLFTLAIGLIVLDISSRAGIVHFQLALTPEAMSDSSC